MTAPASTSHAALRARERYGIVLTVADMVALERRCRDGEGKLETTASGQTLHMLIVGDRVLWLAFLPPHRSGAMRPWGVITTVLPPEVGEARAKRDGVYMRRRQVGGGSRWKRK